MSRSNDVAWAAGLFEGEGCFTACTINKRRDYRYPRAQLNMTDRETVERFQRIMGHGKVGGPYMHKGREHNKPTFTWYAYGREAVLDVLALLEPWLSDRRVAAGISTIETNSRREGTQLSLGGVA